MSLSRINASISNVLKEKQRAEYSINSSDIQFSNVDQIIAKEYQKEAQTVKKKKTRYIPIVIIIILICYAVPLALNGINALNEINSSRNFNDDLKIYVDNHLGGMGNVIAFIFAVIAAILFWIFILCRKSFKRIKAFKNKKDEGYWKSESENRKKSILVQKEHAKTQLIDCQNKEQALSKQKFVILNNLRQAKEKLDELYSENILSQKYRNFVAVTSMCEYLDTGRCTSIKGHGGIIVGIIISNLNKINQKLSDIAINQRMLFDEL